MKVLITGAAGFIGSQLAHRLWKDGAELILIDNFSYGSKDNLMFEDHDFNSEIKNVDIRDKEAIKAKMDDFTFRRESKQPLELPSAGSTFKRPEGYFAGTLIVQTGLKGLQVGGAQISTKHAGFVVNSGNATAKDVLNLIKAVQDEVYARNGVKLFPEVRIIGE